MPAAAQFITLVSNAFKNRQLVKLTLGHKRNTEGEIKNIAIKHIALKAGDMLSFVFRYPTNDITKNYALSEALPLLNKMLEQDFFNADLITTTHTHHLLQNATQKSRLVSRPAAQQPLTTVQQHDKIKKRLVKKERNIYLHELGITTADGVVKKDKQDKYKQINHYVEIIDGLIKNISFSDPFQVTDMGCGKGYLTFALHDYLTTVLQRNAVTTGIEIRDDLVSACNQIANKAGFNALHFAAGSISETQLTQTDMLVALHACDTATDDAIYKGIQANAKVIICAPCCHKQIRKQMKPDNALSLITKHGILLERQAEMVTDSIRALLLEAHGYKTKVFDFIATEHTPKNVMLSAVKSAQKTDATPWLQRVKELKALFNIKSHYLEELLGV